MHEKLAAMAKIVDLHLNMYFIDNALEVHQIVVLGCIYSNYMSCCDHWYWYTCTYTNEDYDHLIWLIGEFQSISNQNMLCHLSKQLTVS